MGKSTVILVVLETCQVIWDELVQEFMPVPSEAHLKIVISDFSNRWNFPNFHLH
jgi:hypothetical protein